MSQLIKICNCYMLLKYYCDDDLDDFLNKWKGLYELSNIPIDPDRVYCSCNVNYIRYANTLKLIFSPCSCFYLSYAYIIKLNQIHDLYDHIIEIKPYVSNLKKLAVARLLAIMLINMQELNDPRLAQLRYFTYKKYKTYKNLLTDLK